MRTQQKELREERAKESDQQDGRERGARRRGTGEAAEITSGDRRIRRHRDRGVWAESGDLLKGDRRVVNPLLLRGRQCLLLAVVPTAVSCALARRTVHRTLIVPLRAARHLRLRRGGSSRRAVRQRGSGYGRSEKERHDDRGPTRHAFSLASRPEVVNFSRAGCQRPATCAARDSRAGVTGRSPCSTSVGGFRRRVACSHA
jgi:hypothetical protein